MGYDKPKSLGGLETGGKAALPIWIDYMSSALQGVPDNALEVPTGVSAIRIDPTTGLRAKDDHDGVTEYFYHEFPPPEPEESSFSLIPGFLFPGHGSSTPTEKQDTAPQRPDQLF